MMAKQKVLLLGATGETGGSLLNGLLADGEYDITALVRESSSQKPAAKALGDRGVNIVVGDSTADVATLTKICKGFDVVVSAIDAGSQLAQLNLVDAAAAAGVKRFVPCGWTTISPRGGIMQLRDQKEEVQDRVHQHRLPYTMIDCGFWHVLSFPAVPSGRLDYAAFLGEKTTVYADGTQPNLLSHLPDIGKWTARILKDERTLNKRVVIWSDNVTQLEIFRTVEQLTGEKIDRQTTSAGELKALSEQLREQLEASPEKGFWNMASLQVIANEYNWSKYVRGDNSLENAKYLGYLDAKELYPDFEPVTFEQFVRDELLPGKAVKPYPHKG